MSAQKGQVLYKPIKDLKYSVNPTTNVEPNFASLNVDEKAWKSKGCYMSKSTRFPHQPASISRNLAFADSHSGTIHSSIQAHPMRYAASLQSGLPRVPPRRTATMAHVGPGAYSAPSLGVKEPYRQSSTFSSSCERMKTRATSSAANFSVVPPEKLSQDWHKSKASRFPHAPRFLKPADPVPLLSADLSIPHRVVGTAASFAAPGPGAYIPLSQWPSKYDTENNSNSPSKRKSPMRGLSRPYGLIYSVPHSA